MDDHKTYVAGVFDRSASDYDRIGDPVFAPLGHRLVELAGVAPGDRVLDVATGAGAVLVPAANAAGPSGRVVGIDIAPAMVARAAAEIDRLGLANAEARTGDAEALDLPDASFDRALCAFSIFFFPHPERALAELARVLRPGGTVAISSWRMRDARFAFWPRLLKEHGVEARQLMVRSFDEPDELQQALAAAGFEHVDVLAEPRPLTLRDPGEWWRSTWGSGFRAALERLPPDRLERFRAAALAEVEALGEPDGSVVRRAEALFAVGRRL
jgi:ubiquinone/menaquinone biosynthesis C-methylase UbiE